MRRLAAILSTLLLAATLLPASSRSSSRPSSRSSSTKSSRSVRSPKTKCVGCARDKHGKIKRSGRATASFKKTHPCPSTGKTRGACPGYQIDHRTPLSKGGSDSPDNMQWLSTGEHKAKTARDVAK